MEENDVHVAINESGKLKLMSGGCKFNPGRKAKFLLQNSDFLLFHIQKNRETPPLRGSLGLSDHQCAFVTEKFGTEPPPRYNGPANKDPRVHIRFKTAQSGEKGLDITCDGPGFPIFVPSHKVAAFVKVLRCGREILQRYAPGDDGTPLFPGGNGRTGGGGFAGPSSPATGPATGHATGHAPLGEAHETEDEQEAAPAAATPLEEEAVFAQATPLVPGGAPSAGGERAEGVTLRKGERAVICNLVRSPALNGVLVTLDDFDDVNGRLALSLVRSGEKKSLRSVNLSPAASPAPVPSRRLQVATPAASTTSTSQARFSEPTSSSVTLPSRRRRTRSNS